MYKNIHKNETAQAPEKKKFERYLFKKFCLYNLLEKYLKKNKIKIKEYKIRSQRS